MKAVVQRVKSAEVIVNDQSIAKIDAGLLIFLGINRTDDHNDIKYLVDKITNLRIFESPKGKMDLSVRDIKGSLLLVSQFTLYGTCQKGRRPDFGLAAPADQAKKLYSSTVDSFKATGIPVREGEFQAHMQVKLQNDGPVTLIIESPPKQP